VSQKGGYKGGVISRQMGEEVEYLSEMWWDRAYWENDWVSGVEGCIFVADEINVRN